MPHKSVVKAAAWLEILVGLLVLTVPDIPCLLLFATEASGVAMPVARFAGIALVALGLSCLPTASDETRGNAVSALFLFNFGTAILFTWVAVATSFRGSMLWPGAILHAVIAIALFPGFMQRIRAQR